MYNIKKRFGTINMTKEFEETVLNDTKQMAELYEEIETLNTIIINKDIIIKNLNDENVVLKDKIFILESLLNKNDNIHNSDENLEYLKVNEPISDKDIKINEEQIKKLSEENEKLINNIKEIKEDYINIQKKNEEVEENIDKINNLESVIEELNEKLKNIPEINEEEIDKKYKQKYDSKLEEELKNIKVNIPSPSNSKENKKSSRLEGHRFENKKLPILERCNVIAYKYNKNLDNEVNKNKLQILHFISSEHKVLVRFNSSIAEQVNEKDEDMWEEIYKFKIENNELKDAKSNKSQFKYKVKRCKELYDLYGENLSRFQIYVNYLGKLSSKEWEKYLEEFDKLYNTINIENMCQHKYQNSKVCGRIDCKTKHKESK